MEENQLSTAERAKVCAAPSISDSYPTGKTMVSRFSSPDGDNNIVDRGNAGAPYVSDFGVGWNGISIQGSSVLPDTAKREKGARNMSEPTRKDLARRQS